MKRATAFSSEGGFSPSHFLNSCFQKHTWLIMCIIILMGVLLRLPHLNRSLWYDELWSTSVKLKNPVALGVTILFDPHPPFYAIFMYLWTSVFGDSEISVRIPPLMFGLSSILLTYYIALKFLGKNTSLLVSFLMCINPVHIWYSREARPYSATLFFCWPQSFPTTNCRTLEQSREFGMFYILHQCFSQFSAIIILLFSSLWFRQ